MALVAALRGLSPDQIAVRHVPFTARYARAGARLRYLLRHGVDLGQREHDELSAREALELAVWAPPPSGRGPGYYACFRIHLDAGTPVFGVLFAFYDGTDGSPGFSSLTTARAFAAHHGFHDEDED